MLPSGRPLRAVVPPVYLAPLGCRALELDADGSDHKCEARLIAEARNLNAKGKLIIPIIDDAHLLPPDALHKLRLLLEDFPKNHNLILVLPAI